MCIELVYSILYGISSKLVGIQCKESLDYKDYDFTNKHEESIECLTVADP